VHAIWARVFRRASHHDRGAGGTISSNPIIFLDVQSSSGYTEIMIYEKRQHPQNSIELTRAYVNIRKNDVFPSANIGGEQCHYQYFLAAIAAKKYWLYPARCLMSIVSY